jgi:aspartate racemase
MGNDFFIERLASHGLDVVTPADDQHETVNRIIYEELVHGRVLDSSRRTVVKLVDQMWDHGAEGVVLGCTELEMLIKQADCDLPVFPCTTLHVQAGLDAAMDTAAV